MVDLTLFAISCRELYDIYGVYTRGHQVTFWDDAYESEIVEFAYQRSVAAQFPNRAVDRDRVFSHSTRASFLRRDAVKRGVNERTRFLVLRI